MRLHTSHFIMLLTNGMYMDDSEVTAREEVEEVMGTTGEGRRLDLGGELTAQGTDGVLYIVCLKLV